METDFVEWIIQQSFINYPKQQSSTNIANISIQFAHSPHTPILQSGILLQCKISRAATSIKSTNVYYLKYLTLHQQFNKTITIIKCFLRTMEFSRSTGELWSTKTGTVNRLRGAGHGGGSATVKNTLPGVLKELVRPRQGMTNLRSVWGFGYDTRGGPEDSTTARRDELRIRYNNSLSAQIRLLVCRDVLTIAEMNICWHGCWEMHTWALGCYRLVCVDESTPVLRFWLVAC